MPNRSRETKIAYGMRRKPAIEAYMSRPFPIVDKNNPEQNFVADANEKFVPLFHYKNTRISNRNERRGVQSKMYLVSDRGNVISFDNPDAPEVLKRNLANPEKGADSYVITGDGWYVHILVWVSFAADSIINDTPFDQFFDIDKNLLTIDNLTSLVGSWSGNEIHHRDRNRQNNCLGNLECDSKIIHDWLHAFQRMTAEERADAISEQEFLSPTIIYAEPDFLSISELDMDKEEHIKGMVQTKAILFSVVNKIMQNVKDDKYLDEKKVISIQTSMHIELYRFSAVIENNKLTIQKEPRSEKIDCIFELVAI